MATLMKNGLGKEGQAHVNANGSGACKANGQPASLEFVLVPHSSMDALIRVLKARLPKSANVYNSTVRLSRNPDGFEMYTLGGNLTQEAWILAKFPIQAFGAKQLFAISAPSLPSITAVPSHVRQAFIDTRVIDWDASFEFTALDYAVGSLLTEISTFVKGHVLTSHPHIFYYMSTEEALKLELPDIVSGDDELVRVKQLDTDAGAEFIAGNWAYTGEGTRKYVRTMIEKHPSTGVYVNVQAVSGAISHADLLVGMLATEPAYRNKGYAVVAMKNHLRKLAMERYVPASCVESRNDASNRFHQKVGMVVSHSTVDINNLGF